MANWFEPSNEDRAEWAEWVSEHPKQVRAVAEKFEPWKLYRRKSSSHRVTIVSFDQPKDESQPVTLKVHVSRDFNLVAFERTVFGILPEDLEECELPGQDELLGSANLDPESFRPPRSC